MIARRWVGRVRVSHREAYLDYLRQTGLADYAATPGHIRTQVLRRTVGDTTEYELTTFWDSFDAVRAFAGDDADVARYYPEDAAFLLEMAERVEHWEVVLG